MKLRCIVIWFGAITTAGIAILILAALLLPWLIDSRLVKEKIASALTEKTHGTLTLGRIDLSWFPRPGFIVDDIVMSFEQGSRGKIRLAKIYPSIIDLLTGRLVVRRMQLQEPEVEVHLPAPSEQPLDIEEMEMTLGSLLSYLTAELPGLHVNASNGSAVIARGERAPLIVKNLGIDAVTSSKDLRFDLTMGSSLFERLRIEGEIAQASGSAKLTARVDKLRLKETRVALLHDLPALVQDGELSFDLKIETLGFKKIKTEIDDAQGSLVLVRRGGKANVNAKRLKAHLVYDQGIVEIRVEELEFARPRLKASGEFKFQPSSSSVRMQIRDLDIAEIRPQALQMAGDLPVVKKLFEILQAGAFPEINFASGGGSLADMAMSKNIVITGTMHNGRLSIPDPGLDLTNVEGSLRIAAGILEGKDLAASLGSARGSDGKLRIGLEGKSAPFRLDVAVETGAAQLQSVLLKLAAGERLRRELVKLRNVAGNLSGRLILGERLDALAPVISVSKLDVRAAYDPIPFPILIKHGRLNYERSTVKLDGIQGAVGKSTLAGLNAILHTDQSQGIKITSGRFSLDLEEIHALFRGLPNLRSHFDKVKSVQGKLELADLTLEGVLNDPANWKFTSTGEVRQVAMAHADAPGPITVAQGKFAATEAKFKFAEAAVRMLDGSVRVGGVIEHRNDRPLSLEVSGAGIIGEQMTQWLSRRLQRPEALMLRSPVKIATARIALGTAGDISFRGKLSTGRDAEISLDGTWSPQMFVVRNLTIQDEARIAHFKANLRKDSIDVSFKGLLTEQTLDKIFASFPYQGSSLKGDLQLSASLKNLSQFSARGSLAGTNLLVLLAQDKTLIEKFQIEAAGTSLQIRSADLRWHNSNFAMSGKVAGTKEALRLDIDVAANRLDWAELEQFFGEKKDAQDEKGGRSGSPLGLEGKIRLKTDSFTLEGYQVSPLQMTVSLAPSSLRANIDQAVACGIAASGSIDVVGSEIGLDIRLTAKEAPLKPTSHCLTDGDIDLSGTYSGVGRITGRGDRESLLPSLKGTFDISARDGEFVRSAAADATFDYLNATGDFKVAFPDLDKKSFPYQFIALKGRIEGDNVINDEVVIQSTTLTITGQGKLDLRQQQIDAKGLVSVSLPGNQVIKHIPLIGPLIGARLIGIPLRITGSLDRPDVSYLAPMDVGNELINMPLRALGAPLEAIKLFTPSVETRDRNNLQ